MKANEEIFTMADARAYCAANGFARSRIWWNKLAAGKKFNGTKMRVDGRVCWIFDIREVKRILAEKPVLKNKVIALMILLSFAFATACSADTASWYSSADACGKMTNSIPGCPTASGKGLFDLERAGVLFCASKDHRIGTKLKVTNTANQKAVTCTVLDRGGFKKYGRQIDLGKLAFSKIADPRTGIISVQIKKVTA